MHKNENGQVIFADFHDSYGNHIRVVESSGEFDAVWIASDRLRTSNHLLNVEQAKLVRDALAEFINSCAEEDEISAKE